MSTKPRILRIGATLLFIFMSTGSFAQYAQEVDVYKQKYPNARLVTLQNEKNLHISLNRGNVEVTQEILEEDLYLDESAIHNSKRSVNFSSFFELEKIEASSFVFEKNKYRENKVKDFKEKDEIENSFYDDTRSVNFIFPDLRKGSKSRMKYTEKIKNPRFLTPFYLGDFSPVINNKFTITADKDISIRFLQFNTEGLDLKFSEKEKRGKMIYTWEAQNVDQYHRENGAPSYKSILPHIIPVISYYQANGSRVDVLNNVADLYSWYSSLVKDLNSEPVDEDLVKLVKELTHDKETELEKVRAIYYWTQKNIKYIDFEYALGGFIPREANLVFQKKYGDCKDNSSILQEMLSIAGLKGSLTWLGTRSIPYTYDEVPTPMVDNHMILTYVNAGTTYYLDATGRFIPLELPPSFIQGKEALIAEEDGSFRIQTVPIIPAKQSTIMEETELQIVGDKLRGSSKATVTGYNKIELYRNLERQTGETKLKEYYNSTFEKGNNKFLISSFTENNRYDYDNDFIVSFDFDISDYAKEIGKEIYVNLNLNRDLSNYRMAEDRKNLMEYDYKHSYSYTTVLHIPEGYTVEYMPGNEEFSNEHISAQITYSHEDDKITYTHTVELNSLLLDLDDQKTVNELVKKAEKAYKEVLILKQLKTS